MPKVIMMSSSKGGIGRSATARAILVAAVRSKLKAVCFDTDAQETVLKWEAKRRLAMEALPNAFPAVEVHGCRMADLSKRIKARKGDDIIVVDTSPTIEAELTAVLDSASDADLVLVPTSSSADDLDSILPWYEHLKSRGAKAEIVFNKINRSSKEFIAARNQLAYSVDLVPIEIPQFSDISSALGKGLTSLDVARMRGADEITGLWNHCRRRLGL